MAGKLGMLKQAMSMQKELKKVQKDLGRLTTEFSNNGVTVVAKGDMTIESVQLDMDVLSSMKSDRIDRTITVAVNSALKAVKKEAGAQMAQASGGMGGLADLLGG